MTSIGREVLDRLLREENPKRRREEEDDLVLASKELLDAIESGDATACADAFRAMWLVMAVEDEGARKDD